MPKTKFDVPKFQPINRLRAMILERMYVSKMTLQDLADIAHISYPYMRKLMSKKDPWEWPRDVRQRVCQGLDIHIEQSVDSEWSKEGEW